jgi:hypothetical protein
LRDESERLFALSSTTRLGVMALAGGKGKKEKKWLNSCPRDATVSRFLTLLSNNPIGFLPLTLALTLFVFFFRFHGAVFTLCIFSLSTSSC